MTDNPPLERTDPVERDALEDAALAHFTEYFVRNYPGPHTIIGDPHWHAPRIFRAARYALAMSAKAMGGE